MTSILAFGIISCGCNYRIGKDDLKYIPYEGNVLVVVMSGQNRYDTIYLKDLYGCNDPLSLSSDDCEG